MQHEPLESRKPNRKLRHKVQSPLFFNRELSWLEFNARVLDEANNPRNPLLERLKFLAIFSSNLDEFFMIYVSGMRERVSQETGKLPTEQSYLDDLRAIKARLEPLLKAQYDCYRALLPCLAQHGVHIDSYQDLGDKEKAELTTYFEKQVFPVLTPLAVDPGHPFPYISNLSLSLAVIVRDPYSHQKRFARVKVPEPSALPRMVLVPGHRYRYIYLEELIMAHLDRLFVGMEILGAYPFRITRNADLELQEHVATDLLEFIEEALVRRRFGEVERVEFTSQMPEEIRRTIIAGVKALEEEVYTVDGPLALNDLMPIASLDIPELRDPPFTPSIPPALRGGQNPFDAIKKQDILLHHPYQSFDCVTDFLRAAADDPNVLTIKHTLYRTSGDSPILNALMDAALNGKQVACLVELKARFDEANNITWARQLENAGVHVVYGLLGLKTHCKVTLVVRREADGLRRYLHVGTGNYNPRTATVYTDIGLLTCDDDFGADATELFNYLTGYSHQKNYRRFLVAPINLRSRLLELIEREISVHRADTPGRIIAKMNALVDPEIIQSLYRASQAGVQIDLIVRGMCCLRPGVPGLSENIRVISIVGRFLEHSRIFYFRNGGNEDLYIGSADWMPRNLDRRIEVVVPILDPNNRKELLEVLQIMLEDNMQAWDLHPDGCYTRRHPALGEAERSSQRILLQRLANV
ncbi:MAG TPA: polyphosphate kinase 1 [Chthonomonas sp.]|uniref:polyphosphate kinase 1 n=1 Tax=Chthonomonas sp. TaxID=2282153 RepID=UPI002B4B7E9E|nr:polyphosphate kinase 1 [Chthonomonas sp.]HLI48969.1 polyphosphate kinase 1 [Chthonomonas sp.]